MKVLLEFNLPEEQEEYEDAMNGSKYRMELDDIWTQVFRPYFKHGYHDDVRLNELLETDDGKYIIEQLIKLYRSSKNVEG